jgi:multidrug efflux pump subunit AcrA (membrane-fusion protein)
MMKRLYSFLNQGWASHPRRMLATGVILVIALFLVVSSSRSCRNAEASDTQSKDRYFSVQKGCFDVTVVLEGNLDAIKRHTLKCEGRGRYGLEIIEVVENSTPVKEGDVVVRFSRDKYDEAMDKLILQIDNESKNLLLVEKDLQMVQVANVNTIKFASDLLRSSREQLQKYEEQDAPRTRSDLVKAIDTAEDKQKQAQRTLSDAKGAVSDARMEDAAKVAALEAKATAAKKALEVARAAAEKAQYKFRVFRRYDHPRKLRSLTEAATKNYMNLERNLVDAASKVAQAHGRIASHEKTLAQLEEESIALADDIEKLTIRAPVDGIVALGAARTHRRSEQKDILVGTKIGPREVVGTIPDLSKFVVNIRLPEEYRSLVKTGLPANVRSKAIPDLLIAGELEFIAPMAEHLYYWDKSSPKSYGGKIATDETDKRLMPGMTMRVEIVVETVKDVLHVPVEAVYNKEGTTFCKVKGLAGLDEREVETDRSSNDYVEIVSGLKEGEDVFLHREQGTGG